MSRKFGELRSPQVGEAAARNALILFPVGQTEEHATHLPLSTDTLIAEGLCDSAAEALDGKIETYVLPPVHYGFSAKVMDRWPGTFRVGMDTIIAMVREVCESIARMGFKKLAIVSGHGNHTGAMRVVARQVADSYAIDVPVVMPAGMVAQKLAELSKGGPGASCHAGEYETSLMMHLHPEMVDLSKAVADDRLSLTGDFSSSEVFWSTWMRQRSTHGAYGDPTCACAETGRQLFEAHVERLVEFLEVYYAHQLDED